MKDDNHSGKSKARVKNGIFGMSFFLLTTATIFHGGLLEYLTSFWRGAEDYKYTQTLCGQFFIESLRGGNNAIHILNSEGNKRFVMRDLYKYPTYSQWYKQQGDYCITVLENEYVASICDKNGDCLYDEKQSKQIYLMDSELTVSKVFHFLLAILFGYGFTHCYMKKDTLL